MGSILTENDQKQKTTTAAGHPSASCHRNGCGDDCRISHLCPAFVSYQPCTLGDRDLTRLAGIGHTYIIRRPRMRGIVFYILPVRGSLHLSERSLFPGFRLFVGLGHVLGNALGDHRGGGSHLFAVCCIFHSHVRWRN